MQTRMKA